MNQPIKLNRSKHDQTPEYSPRLTIMPQEQIKDAPQETFLGSSLILDCQVQLSQQNEVTSGAEDDKPAASQSDTDQR
ncbi:hypothetical protein E5288_WYG005378 [Bos mutus]|uniref:Uncharacterized protein n=1 Tax=Bos mutus TaxID=72004 RepID=A0A6B0SF23_9CETA|nr:hypothetical protein [Bos mutus]